MNPEMEALHPFFSNWYKPVKNPSHLQTSGNFTVEFSKVIDLPLILAFMKGVSVLVSPGAGTA